MKKLYPSLALLAALAAGFWFGRGSASASARSAARGPAAPGASGFAVVSPGAARAEPLTVAQIVERIAAECRNGIWRRTPEWDAILRALAPGDLAELVPALRELILAPAQEELRKTLVSLWAEKDPEAALVFARSLPASKLSAELIRLAVQGWLYSDSAAAIAWIRDLPKGALRNDAIDLALPILSATNPNSSVSTTCPPVQAARCA